MGSRSLSLRLRQTTHIRCLSTTRPDQLRNALLDRKFPIEYDRLDSQAPQFLWTSLQDFLPPRPKSWTGAVLFPGSHIVYFPPAVPEHDLLPDGTDLLHAPDPSYKYRLWAGGDVSYPQRRAISTETYQGISLKQEIVAVNAKAAKEGRIWIKIQRSIHLTESASHRRGIYQTRPDVPMVVENRWLVFYQSKPSVHLDNVTPPPAEPYYSHSMRTTRALLFRFSALTFNAHAVHIDPEYTKHEYGLPALLVHGPLTFVLMMEILVRGLDQYGREIGFDEHALRIFKVDYRNIMPVFVGEEISICCGPANKDHVKFESTHPRRLRGDREERQWDVWVQKLVNGQPSMCVKATAVVVWGQFVPRLSGATDSEKPNPLYLQQDPAIRRIISYRNSI